MNKKEWKIFWRLKLKEIWEVCKWGFVFACIISAVFCMVCSIGYLVNDLSSCAKVYCHPIIIVMGFVGWAILIVGLIACWIRRNVKKAKRLAKNQR